MGVFTCYTDFSMPYNFAIITVIKADNRIYNLRVTGFLYSV